VCAHDRTRISVRPFFFKPINKIVAGQIVREKKKYPWQNNAFCSLMEIAGCAPTSKANTLRRLINPQAAGKLSVFLALLTQKMQGCHKGLQLSVPRLGEIGEYCVDYPRFQCARREGESFSKTEERRLHNEADVHPAAPRRWTVFDFPTAAAHFDQVKVCRKCN
jgi:hypothetical protein